jgi:hypothetical protein
MGKGDGDRDGKPNEAAEESTSSVTAWEPDEPLGSKHGAKQSQNSPSNSSGLQASSTSSVSENGAGRRREAGDEPSQQECRKGSHRRGAI